MKNALLKFGQTQMHMHILTRRIALYKLSIAFSWETENHASPCTMYM